MLNTVKILAEKCWVQHNIFFSDKFLIHLEKRIPKISEKKKKKKNRCKIQALNIAFLTWLLKCVMASFFVTMQK